jgi:hypothetical protein
MKTAPEQDERHQTRIGYRRPTYKNPGLFLFMPPLAAGTELEMPILLFFLSRCSVLSELIISISRRCSLAGAGPGGLMIT